MMNNNVNTRIIDWVIVECLKLVSLAILLYQLYTKLSVINVFIPCRSWQPMATERVSGSSGASSLQRIGSGSI